MAAMQTAPCYSLRGDWHTHAVTIFVGFSHVVQQLSVLNGGAPKQAVLIDHSSFASKVRVMTFGSYSVALRIRRARWCNQRQVGRLTK